MSAVRRQLSLLGWLSADAISLTGTRISMIAIPWFVLTTTGSATQTGLVAFCEMAPLVTLKAAAGPLIDRVGARRVAIACDLLSVLAVGAIPLLHELGMLSFPTLLSLVAVAGTLRGPGDGAKNAMVPQLVDAGGVPMERATGLASAVERTASMTGAAFAGGLVALIGAADAIAVDAATFALSGMILLTTTRGLRRRQPVAANGSRASYLTELRDGWNFLRKDAVLVAICVMVAITNLLDQSFSVLLVPVWARHTGYGVAAVGVLFAVFSGASILGSVAAASWAARVPRFKVYLVAFLVAGFPKFAVLAMGARLWLVLAVAVIGGVASGFINPILGAVIFERIPEPMMGRVSSLNTALCWSLIPFGGLLGGVLVTGIGLSPALLAVGTAYFLVTMLPALQPQWRDLDRPTPAPAAELTPPR